jgi:hypothetical protein
MCRLDNTAVRRKTEVVVPAQVDDFAPIGGRDAAAQGRRDRAFRFQQACGPDLVELMLQRGEEVRRVCHEGFPVWA